MSVTYRVDHEHNMIRVDASGRLSDSDVQECVREVVLDADVRPGMDVLVDLRDLSSTVLSTRGVDEGLVVLREFGQLIAGNKMALVATGYDESETKLLDLLLRRFPATVRLFDDVSHAEAWLGWDPTRLKSQRASAHDR